MFRKENTQGEFCFLARWLNVPAPIIVGYPLAIHLKAQLRNLTAVDTVYLPEKYRN